jgi:hypothetical protein
MEKWLDEMMNKQSEKAASKSSTGKGSGKGADSELGGKKRKVTVSKPPADSRIGTLEQATIAIGELSLETSRNERLLTGCICRTFLLAPDASLEEPLRVCSIVNDPATKHQCTWAALIKALSNFAPKEATRSSIQALTQHRSADIAEWSNSVNFCRVTYTYDGQKIKIVFWTEQPLEEISKAVARVLLSAGATFQWGPPPRSWRERRAAQAIAQLKR